MNPIKALWFWFLERFHLIKLNGDYKRYLLSGLSVKQLQSICNFYGLETKNKSQDYETKKIITTPKNYKQLQRTIMMKLNREDMYNAVIKTKAKKGVKTYEVFAK